MFRVVACPELRIMKCRKVIMTNEVARQAKACRFSCERQHSHHLPHAYALPGSNEACPRSKKRQQCHLYRKFKGSMAKVIMWHPIACSTQVGDPVRDQALEEMLISISRHSLCPWMCRMSAAAPSAADAACLATTAADASRFPLKIGGLFLILVASLVGALLPLFSRSNKLPTLYLLARAFAGTPALQVMC